MTKTTAKVSTFTFGIYVFIPPRVKFYFDFIYITNTKKN